MKKFNYFILSMLIVAFSSCTVIDSSEVGIQFKKFSLTEQGKLDAIPVSGWVTYNPINTGIYTYPVTIQRVDYKPFAVTAKDAATFTMDAMLAYQVDRAKAIDVFAIYRKPLQDIEAGYLKTVIYDAYRITANQYTSDELMANRGKFEMEVKAMLDSALLSEGFIVSEFTTQIIPPASLANAIDAKNQAVQESLKAENLVKQAEANAKIAIAKAEGEAQAILVKAKAEAEANKIIANSLTENLVKLKAIETWNGALPQYQGGNNIPMINLK